MGATVFPISKVINVSVQNPPVSLNEYNTSNLCIFTTELPANSFGGGAFQLYQSPGQVATDFGSASVTAQMANAIFSQNPNILLGGGQLIIAPIAVAIETLTLSGVPASGTFVAVWNGEDSAAINWNDTAAQIQVKLRAMAGLEEVVVTGSLAGEAIHVTMNGVYGATPPAFTVTSNSLQTGGSVAITFVITNSAGQTLLQKMTALQGAVQYFGMLTNHTLADIGQTDLLAAAAYVQANPIMWVLGSYSAADVAPGGMIDLLRTGGFTQSRSQLYEDPSNVGINTILESAAYAGRAFSVNFSGTLTTLTMNLKQLATINPDPNINNTDLTAAGLAGADVYVSIGGSPEVLSSGANQFFDNVYNQLWFAGAIQVAYFNYLAQTSTKILQTEQGMSGLKDAIRQVCLQAVNNGYLAPGQWNSSTTFGDLTNFYNNITQYGFYIYSTPISQQSQTNRANRVSPLIQIAAKEAGAIQSGSVVVFINP